MASNLQTSRNALMTDFDQQFVEYRVSQEHLKQLDRIHELLKALNDPYAGSQDIANLLEKIPVLAARCIRRARVQMSGIRVKSANHMLALLGNRVLEAELLTLLEDLTILKSELETQ